MVIWMYITSSKLIDLNTSDLGKFYLNVKIIIMTSEIEHAKIYSKQ